jgi:hypothetical protein
MQIIAGAAPVSRSDRFGVARSAVTSVLLVLAGVMVGWLCFATPLVTEFTPHGRPGLAETATGVVAWGFAILVPAALLIIGVARIAGTIEEAISLRSNSATGRLVKSLGPDHLAARNVLLPGGRRIHELVLGPFGVLVIGAVPPPSVSRHVGTRWEVRDERGRWVPIEEPLDRAARDAERLRGWLSTDDRDFLIRVYAAVVTDDRRVARTASCAVVSPGQLAGWIGALPAQRGLTAERRERIAEMIGSLGSPA